MEVGFDYNCFGHKIESFNFYLLIGVNRSSRFHSWLVPFLVFVVSVPPWCVLRLIGV